MSSTITFDAVTKSYPAGKGSGTGSPAVDSFTARIEAGTTTVLLGSSGCGKTTLLRMVNRMVEPTGGVVLIDDEDIATRDAVALRRTLLPLRDVFYQLAVRGDFAIFKGESTVYLRDVYDHNMQLIESLDASRDMVLSMMDIYLSFQSNRMNQQMRVLTVITIIFMPLTVITGIYGMNFDNMPELHWHYGYFMVLGVMLCIIIGLLIFFSRRKWL